jgi:hypothetical protein
MSDVIATGKRRVRAGLGGCTAPVVAVTMAKRPQEVHAVQEQVTWSYAAFNGWCEMGEVGKEGVIKSLTCRRIGLGNENTALAANPVSMHVISPVVSSI